MLNQWSFKVTAKVAVPKPTQRATPVPAVSPTERDLMGGKHLSKFGALLALLAVCVALSGLSACSSGQGTASSENSGSDAAETSTATTSAADSENGFEGPIGSWTGGGTDVSTTAGNDYFYTPALYVTANGVNDASNTSRIKGGSYDASQAADIIINDQASGHNGIIVNDAAYNITNATINMITDADGTDTCDFSGKGTAIAAFGENADVTVSNSEIDTEGVATMGLFIDSGASLTLKGSTLKTQGGTLYPSYQNTPDQPLMVAPPWVLGIMGTARTTNLMGAGSTLNVLDSDAHAGSWGIYSTDSGSDVHLNVLGTTATLDNAHEDQAAALQADGGQISETLDNPYTTDNGSGYGSYVIGNAVELFAGSTLNVGTYGAIFTGGTARYTALEQGQTYALANAAGRTTAEYTAAESKTTTVNSDTFGFMAHQNANTLTIDKGTAVNSGYATFLVKSGSSNESIAARIDDAKLTNGGVLIQVMDNDDATTGDSSSASQSAAGASASAGSDPGAGGGQGAGAGGGPPSADGGAGSGGSGSSGAGAGGGSGAGGSSGSSGSSMAFTDHHDEDAGFNTSAATTDSTVQDFTFTNGDYSGNIYNASGSDGLSATTLNVTFGKGATLTGAVAKTSAIHVTYDGSAALKENGCKAFDNADAASAFAGQYQNTSFTINEYFSMGHVANLICDNGGNAINVSLTDNAVWNVTSTSTISTLSRASGARVNVPEGVTLTVGDTVYTDCTLGA